MATHVFDYIVLRASPGLTSCKDLAMALHTIILCIQCLVISCVGILQPYSCERSANFEQNMANNEHVVQLENVKKLYENVHIIFKFLHGELHAYVRMCTFNYKFCSLLHIFFITKYFIKYICVNIIFVQLYNANLNCNSFLLTLYVGVNNVQYLRINCLLGTFACAVCIFK